MFPKKPNPEKTNPDPEPTPDVQGEQPEPEGENPTISISDSVVEEKVEEVSAPVEKPVAAKKDDAELVAVVKEAVAYKGMSVVVVRDSADIGPVTRIINTTKHDHEIGVKHNPKLSLRAVWRKS